MPSPPRVTRRQLVVAGAGAAAASYVTPAWARRLVSVDAKVGPGTFADGVASGEPSTDAVTLWSRLTTESQRSGARLIVARDEGLKQVVQTVVVPTAAAVDGALKARVSGLEPDTLYYYGFESAEGHSDIGRTKTVPPADSETPLRIAVSSCQNWPAGFFTGHQDAAKQELDIYCFLGDYTYEYGPSTGSQAGRDDPAASNDLHSYRAKIKLYRSDKHLRELHRLHPVAHIWDDHEVADNYSDNNPRPSDLQRADGYQASFEWLPKLADRDERYRAYRTFRLGQLELFIFDERQYRTGDNDGQAKSILGRKQLDWAKAKLASSTARWKVIANEVMFVPLGAAGQGVNSDQWDGYPDDRRELLDVIANKPVSNTIFLTGDIHTFFTARVQRDLSSGPSVATEYVCGSITSSGFPSLSGLTTVGIQAANPWITYANGSDHGYGRLDFDSTEARITYRAAPIDTPDATARDLAVYRQPAGANDYETVSQGAARSDTLPLPPPPQALRSAAAPNRALAARRRAHERLEREARERAEQRARQATRRRGSRRS
jgi:phosphodiesterase/alkaline phosphatase D-like protein